MVELHYPHTLHNVREEDTLFYFSSKSLRKPTELAPSSRIDHGYHYDPTVLMQHVNRALARMSTDKVKAKLSFRNISQKITFHMTPNEFTLRYQSAMGTILSFRSSVVTREYASRTLGGKDLRLTPSTTVQSPGRTGEFTYHKEADCVVDMHQWFSIIYVYTDVVESRIVGDSLALLLRSVPVRGQWFHDA